MAFTFTKTALSEVILVESKIYQDSRGEFQEVFKTSDFEALGISSGFKQINYSHSKNAVLRGLHYQKPPRAMAKLVRVLAGEIYDVAVDIRKHSRTFGRWVGYTLSSENKKMLFIPEGFAHGFHVTSLHAEVMYFCSDIYAPELEQGIAWNDPSLAISWPSQKPVLSEKDNKQPFLAIVETPF